MNKLKIFGTFFIYISFILDNQILVLEPNYFPILQYFVLVSVLV